MNESRRADMAKQIGALQKHVALAGKTVLEVGADWHGVSASLLLHGGAAKVISTNLEPGWATQIPADPRIERRRIDARLLEESLGSASIDVLFGVAVMEHINDIPRFLASASKVLRPGGTIFVQGGPIWTSARGHHVWVEGRSRSYHFSDATNPIDNWSHLVNDRDSMKDDLLRKGIDASDAEAIVVYVYESQEVNRVGYRTMRECFARSAFRDQVVSEGCWNPPAVEVLDRIARGPYGAEERFEVTDITLVGTA